MFLACILLSLVSAASFAVSTVLQQSRARAHALDDVDAGGKRPRVAILSIFGRLVRDKVWMLGWVFNLFGFYLHAVALHLGPIAVVQSLMITQLLLALVIGEVHKRERPSLHDVLGAATVAAGVGALVLQRSEAGRRVPGTHDVTLWVLCCLGVALVLLALSRARRGLRWRGGVIGLAAGMCFSCTAVLLTLAARNIDADGLAGLVSWPVVGLVATTVIGTVLVQEAFASGPLAPPLTAMTVADPVLSMTAGAVLLDASRPDAGQLFVGLPISAVLITIGVAVLANSPTLREELGRDKATGVPTG